MYKVLFISSVFISSFFNSAHFPKQVDYDALWKKVQQLESEGLYKSGMEIVEEIFTKAVAEKREDHQIKSIIYRSKFSVYLQDDDQVSSLRSFASDIASLDSEEGRALGYSMLAESYHQFATNNMWRFSDRTKIFDNKSEDFSNWSLSKLQDETIEYYKRSLQNKAQLVKYDIAKISLLLTEPGETKILEGENLFELLAFRALQHFNTAQSFQPDPANAFKINDEQWMGSAASFLKLSAPNADKHMAYSIEMYQNLLNHYNSRDLKYHIIDLKRLKYIRQNASFDNKENVYLERLEQKINDEKSSDVKALIAYYLSQEYINRANERQNNLELPSNGYFKKASELLNGLSDNVFSSQIASLKATIASKHFYIQAEKVYPKNQAIRYYLKYRNTPQVHHRLVKIEEKDLAQFRRNYDQKDQLQRAIRMEPLKSWSLALPSAEDMDFHATEMGLDGLEYGHYILLASSNNDFKNASNDQLVATVFQVSDLSVVVQTVAMESSFFVVDRTTGNPIEDVSVYVYENKYSPRANKNEQNLIAEGTTDEDGRYVFSGKQRNFTVSVSRADDKLRTNESFYHYEDRPRSGQIELHTFTDRAIYRPGQLVYFKTLILQRDASNLPAILPNQKVKLVFRDANYQEITTREYNSNAFGTIEGTLQLPSSGLNGSFQIQMSAAQSRSNHAIRVEEYKRPSFKIELDTLQGAYALGDEIPLEGKAISFAGVAITSADLSYRITRSEYYFYYCSFYRPYYPVKPSEIIAVGKASTDQDGMFKLKFPSYKADNNFVRNQYNIEITVVDDRGESHSSNKILNLSNDPFIVKTDLKEGIFADELSSVNLSVKNADGKELDVKTNYKVLSLSGPEDYLVSNYWGKSDVSFFNRSEFKSKFPYAAFGDEMNPEKWEAQEVVFEGKADGVNPILKFDQLKGGYYKLQVNVSDDLGNEVVHIQYFNASGDNKTPINQLIWASDLDQTLEVGSNVNLRIQSPINAQKVYYQLSRPNKDGRQEWLQTNGNIKFKIEEEDRGSVLIRYWTIYQNRYHEFSKEVSVPWSNKELQVSYNNFREVVEPGVKESWNVKISGASSATKNYEVLAAMYDASLDQFVKNEWEKMFYPRTYHKGYWRGLDFDLGQMLKDYNRAYERVRPIDDAFYPRINWFNSSLGGHYGNWGHMADYETAGMPVPRAAQAKSRMSEVVEESKDEMVVSKNMSNEAVPPLNTEDKLEELTSFSPRENLNELVFFYPNMKTDNDGDLVIDFTSNEALTEWKFQLFAHSKDLDFVFDTKKIKTKKELMILPNVSRFLRQGDDIYLTASINNLSDKMLSGDTWIVIEDAITAEDITSKFIKDPKKKLDFSHTQSNGIDWKLTVPDDQISNIKISYFVRSGSFTDGESHVIPVLSNRKLVTESMAIYLPGNSDKIESFDALDKLDSSKTIKAHSWQLECTSNPVWFAIKSMPYLSEKSHENTVDVAQRLFANAISKDILDANPSIGQVFKQWENDADALKSNLNKNEAFKIDDISATPWLREAQSEEAQMKNIALLFNENNLAQQRKEALQTLAARQLQNGGFNWFPGGRDNWFITQSVMTSFGHLKSLNINLLSDPKMSNLANRAIQYLDDKLVEYYQKIGKKDSGLSSTVIQYLYMRSFYDQKMNGQTQKAVSHFYELSEKEWLDKNTYLQAMLAFAALRDGKENLVNKIEASLLERAIKDEAIGTYWKRNLVSYNWYDNKVEQQAMIISFFHERGADQSFLDGMKTWLLQNKQTNRWSNNKTTAFAIYALLLDRSSWINTNQLVDVKINNVGVFEDGAEAGTGYQKKQLFDDQINLKLKKMSFSNPNPQVAWAGTYFQYFEDINNIEKDTESPISINKALFLQIDTPAERVIKPIEGNTVLNPGDIIKVRIELNCDRPMEFIHMRDMRASGLEPVNVLSQYKYQEGLYYYESTKDLSTDFFFDRMPKGKFVFEYDLKVVHKGSFSNGITEIQSVYAPEFGSHSEGLKININN